MAAASGGDDSVAAGAAVGSTAAVGLPAVVAGEGVRFSSPLCEGGLGGGLPLWINVFKLKLMARWNLALPLKVNSVSSFSFAKINHISYGNRQQSYNNYFYVIYVYGKELRHTTYRICILTQFFST